MLSFYQQVPKDPAENVSYRRRLLKAAETDKALQARLRTACKQDPLFCINVFFWLLEPREVDESKRVLPFVTWDYQDEAILTLEENIAQPRTKIQHVVIDKQSRDLGFSWIVLAWMVRRWLFFKNEKFGLVSETFEKAASSESDDSLVSKVVFLLSRLPSWMIAPEDWHWVKGKGTLRNKTNDSLFEAYASTADVGRSGRKLAILFDELHAFGVGENEMAWRSAQHTSDCLIGLSTLASSVGARGVFYEIVTQGRMGLGDSVYIKAHWSQHPEKRKGLYRVQAGRIVEEDRTNNRLSDDYRRKLPMLFERLERRGFRIEGKLRSPYYDRECLAPGATPFSIAAELDGEFEASSAVLFDPNYLDRLKEEFAREPLEEGYLMYADCFNPKWSTKAKGGWSLHCTLANGRPPRGNYCIGIDISLGTGGEYGSYSSMFVWDVDTGDEVALFRSNRILIHELAQLGVAASIWFHHALLIPEMNYGGGTWREIVKSKGYLGYVWRRKKDKTAYDQETKDVGYWNADGGMMVLSSLGAAFDRGEPKIRSGIVYEELKGYVVDVKRVRHRAEEKSKEQGIAHGDCAIAAAVGWLGVRYRAPELDGVVPQLTEEELERLGPQSMAWRARYLSWEPQQRKQFGVFS